MNNITHHHHQLLLLQLTFISPLNRDRLWPLFQITTATTATVWQQQLRSPLNYSTNTSDLQKEQHQQSVAIFES